MKRVVVVLIKSIELIYSYNKGLIFMYLMYYITSGFIPAIIMLSNRNIINSIQNGSSSNEIFVWLFIWIIAGGVSSVMDSFFSLYEDKMSLNFDKFIDMKKIEIIYDFSLEEFENSETYDLISRANEQSSKDVISFIQNVFHTIRAFISVFMSALIVSKESIMLVFGISVIIFFRYLNMMSINKKQYRMIISRTKRERVLDYIYFLLYSGFAFKELIVNSTKKSLKNKYIKIKERIILENMCISFLITKNRIFFSVAECIFSGYMYIGLIVKAVEKKIFIGDITLVWNCINQVKLSITEILNFGNEIYTKSMYIELLFKFLDTKRDSNCDKIKINSIKEIEFLNVSYSYGDVSVLKDINLKIKEGDWIQLCGKNGSGKSTFLKLLLGLYKNYEGKIIVNGIDIEKVDKVSYYDCLGVVFQDYYKFETTVKENIILTSEEYDSNRIEKIISILNIENKIFMNDILGSWFGNNQLSEGQWQRIAILRSSFKKKSLYVLDEFDSALDYETRRKISEEFKYVFDGTMGILVSHNNFYSDIINKRIYIEDGKLKIKERK